MEDIPCTHFKNIGTTLLDLYPTSKPNNPPSGLRLYANIVTGKIDIIDSSGSSALPPIPPGFDVDGGTY